MISRVVLFCASVVVLANCGGSRDPVGGGAGGSKNATSKATGGSKSSSDTSASNGGAGPVTSVASDAGAAGASGSAGSSPGLAGAPSAGSSGCDLPSAFRWNSSAALISPQSDATHSLASIKDPTIVFHEGKWHVYATEYNKLTTTYNMLYLSFADFSQAATATQYHMDATPGFSGYRCAPQIFYFAPQGLWYLIYQTQPPTYSTTTDLSKPESWTSGKAFFASEPAIVTQHKGDGFWIDYWVICDEINCHMFFSDDNGNLYRSQTAKTSFPDGFGDPVIVMSDTKSNLFEAANVYKLKGQNKYLLLVEAMGNGRYFRSWTADTLDGTWTPLAATQAQPFASKNNVTGAEWSNDGISHGEMLRDGIDESLTIDACNLRYLFQGRTGIGSEYNLNEYSLGLLTPAP